MIEYKRNRGSQRCVYTASKKSTNRVDSDCCKLREYSSFSSSRRNVYSVRKNSEEDLSREYRCCRAWGVDMGTIFKPCPEVPDGRGDTWLQRALAGNRNSLEANAFPPINYSALHTSLCSSAAISRVNCVLRDEWNQTTSEKSVKKIQTSLTGGRVDIFTCADMDPSG